MKEKKCKHCGQVITKKTNWDVLKGLPLSYLDEHFETIKLCGDTCPFLKQCKLIAISDDVKFSCALIDFTEWLGKEANNE